MGFLTSMNCVVSPRHMKVNLGGYCWGAWGYNPNIGCKLLWHTDIWSFPNLQWTSGRDTGWVLSIQSCNARQRVCKWLIWCGNDAKLSICLLTNPELLWQDFYCHGFILCNSEILSIVIIVSCNITMWNIQSKNFVDGELLWLILNWYIYER